MPIIRNIDSLTTDQISQELKNGGKFVTFQYCISILILTYKKTSDIYFIRSGESTTKHSIGFTLLSIFLGWWGLQGPTHTINSLHSNLNGGVDITEEMLKQYA
ncbi:hypothetical protein [Fulvivirga ligni]|uniref:hypothetical protein n=1 Tax=Fulvivirga ligni TaxID=2904246 RepID=UPI001F1EC05D|nr:hypothetical protein [Fulvivirga ligni]UII23137.1 hypothetical protein LVD16_07850 [Fulvivirga ligni]